MLSWQIHTKIVIAIFCGALSVSAQAANSYSYLFSQGGYNQGGMVSGTFSGTDYNGDGKLVFFVDSDDQEITSYSMVFSGNAIVPAFSHSFADLRSLAYNIGSPFLGDEVYRWDGQWFYENLHSMQANQTSVTSYIGSFSGGIITSFLVGKAMSSTALISVTPVPETETWVMMLAGLALVGRIVRRRKGLVTPGYA